ncbi:glycosyltransferase family 4 protein [Pasteurella multocida]|uniref:Putative (1S)-2-acetamido-2-deoxy-D-galactose transferase n=1 Tax=Pasteurella multocida TaxID=747 RepID=K9MZ17_PASMD|nr:glycosyltransferase family 4 protein [Pasteurella multocida]AFY10920.1 putative (1S)-2-acetamido-2-deoxy-D-galactose transferase [Pasteurella multocida]AFY10928.1 putative (1S)-2-acetamido-2-deoxy-D-galactose transferase [Pasteurella multocida]MCL7786397.1 glycosyltransferase family 4 protein [Pasteurella multocida]MCL7795319.1 glycosyltransferase family 4 protein [Pasteurella multocida]QEU00640.1 glycosyltransferase family 4 protein [Pasteurella multocida]
MSKTKVAILINEYFGAVGTAYGGYGFLARRLVAKYLKNDDIQVDVLLKTTSKNFGMFAKKHIVDGINVYEIPKKPWFAKQWLKSQNYDVYLSIEMTFELPLLYEPDLSKKLIFWIQDPRPLSDWEEIETVELFPEPNYYDQKLYDYIHNLYKQNRIKFISQGYFLNDKAKELYRLDDDVEIEYLPNPIEIDHTFDIATYPKQNNIIFLGRIESVKRGWLFCEIAKKCPEYNFYMLGQTFSDVERNSKIMEKYKNIHNLHFPGHVDGEEKNQYLKDAKILINTSIHEALPVSFLEALSYGTLLVSNQNPEDLTSQFGIHVGTVLGDGFEHVDKYVNAVKALMENDEHRKDLAQQGIKYIKEVHNLPRFIEQIRNIIAESVKF